jgi:hypothetical protein
MLSIAASSSKRQRAWELTYDPFTRRVDLLENQLTAPKYEATLEPLTRIGRLRHARRHS